MKKTPFISVVIPCHNDARFIAIAVQSMLDQTRIPDEIIVCDDASTDNSWLVMSDLAQQNSIIKVIQNKNNLGTVKTRNELSNNVSKHADYIAILDSDDVALPSRIETQVNFLEKNQNYIGCGTDIQIINDEGVVIGSKINQQNPITARSALIQNPFAQSSMMLRTNIFNLVGIYDETLTRGEDHDLWLRILGYGYELAVLPENLSQFRVHKSQGKSAKSRESYLQYAKVRRRYCMRKDFFSVKGIIVTLMYSVFALVPGFIMVRLYKIMYAK